MGGGGGGLVVIPIFIQVKFIFICHFISSVLHLLGTKIAKISVLQ